MSERRDRQVPRPPVHKANLAGGLTYWKLNIDEDERALVLRLFGELRSLLTAEEPSPLLERLFPPAFLDDEEKEAEYQRLMREELIDSRLAQIDRMVEILADPDEDGMGLDQVTALMQSINAVRIVLGTMLGITDDDYDDLDDLDPDDASPEQQLYGYLSWLLDWTVRSLSDTN